MDKITCFRKSIFISLNNLILKINWKCLMQIILCNTSHTRGSCLLCQRITKAIAQIQIIMKKRMIICSILCDPFLTTFLQLRVEFQKYNKKSLDTSVARNEYERVSANLIGQKFPLSKLHDEIELNLKHNTSSIYVYDNLWKINMKKLWSI